MNIPGPQILRRREVGRVGRRRVFQVDLVGGLHIIAADGDGGLEIGGMSSHPAMARHIAKRHFNDVVFTDLAKAEAVDPRDFADLLPHWEDETARLRAEAASRK